MYQNTIMKNSAEVLSATGLSVSFIYPTSNQSFTPGLWCSNPAAASNNYVKQDCVDFSVRFCCGKIVLYIVSYWRREMDSGFFYSLNIISVCIYSSKVH